MPDVEFIEQGKCYVFPKIDGTNGSVWLGDDGEVHVGGRRRELTLEKDNAGFFAYVQNNESIKDFLNHNPQYRLFGEWLVPHSLDTYRDDCWKRFYVFDVVFELEDGSFAYVPYDVYKECLDAYNIDYIPPLAIIDRPTKDQLISYLEKNAFLIKDGCGVGEGVVIKNYEFRNPKGKVIWAKMVRSEFKEWHAKKMMNPNKPLRGRRTMEQQIVDKYVTVALCEKERAKLENVIGKGMKSIIPCLIYNVFECLVREEAWNFVVEFKNPTIDFKLLRHLCERKVKECCVDLFENSKS